jgi:YggT family protein
MGFMGSLFIPVLDVLGFVVSLYFKIVVVDIVLYWMVKYKLITIHNQYAEKLVAILKKLTEPVYKLIGKKVPPVSGVDISPYVLLVAIFIIGSIITNLSIWLHNYL